MRLKNLFSKREILRGAKYAAVGASTFAFDLLLLYVLVEHVGWPEFISAPIAFLIAVSINYVISRVVVFSETKQTIGSGYALFITFAITAAVLITILMYVAVNIFEYNYLISRIAIATLIGIGNYLANTFFNFKIQDSWE